MKIDVFGHAVRALLLWHLFVMPAVAQCAQWQWMAPQRAYALVKEGSALWLVDVRSEAAFVEEHIEGSVNIPAGVIATKRLPKGKMFVLVDDGLGLRKGREAAEALLKSGQERVFLLEGGVPAWQAEGYPLAGKGEGRPLRSVMPDEIKWAQENRIPLRIFDLRDEEERTRGPVAGAVAVSGATLAERLQKVKEMQGTLKKGLAAKLDKPAPVILVFPTAADPRPILERSFREVPVDVRYLAGGYAAWAAKPEKEITIQGACPTCPGGKTGGGSK